MARRRPRSRSRRRRRSRSRTTMRTRSRGRPKYGSRAGETDYERIGRGKTGYFLFTFSIQGAPDDASRRILELINSIMRATPGTSLVSGTDAQSVWQCDRAQASSARFWNTLGEHQAQYGFMVTRATTAWNIYIDGSPAHIMVTGFDHHFEY